MKLLISPHSDDSVLFASYTLMREKPLVLTVTDSWVQYNRGENITAEQRREEDIKAMKVLGCSIVFGRIRDDIIDDWAVKHLLEKFKNFDAVYAPAVQGGNPHHDLIGRLAKERFKNVIQYSTYAKGEWYTKGTKEIVPTKEEIALKEKALACYKSQLSLPATKPHFDAVLKGATEWMV